MEIFVLKNSSLTFTNDGMQTPSKLCTFSGFSLPNMFIQPVVGNDTQAVCQEKLRRLLHIPPMESWPSCFKNNTFRIFASVRSLANEPSVIEIFLVTKYDDSFFLKLLSMKDFVIETKLNAKLTQGENVFELTHTEPIPATWKRQRGTYGISMRLKNIPEKIITGWNAANAKLSGIFDLSVTFNKNIINALYDHTNLPPNTFSGLLKYILNHDEYADMCFVPQGGQPLKSYRVIISAKSHLLTKMINTATRNDITNLFEIELNDMDAKEAKAFLDYLHLDCVQAAISDMKLCFNLLKAGYKYQVMDLMSDMRQLIAIKENKEIGIDLAIDILLFVMEIRRSDKNANTRPHPGLAVMTEEKRIAITVSNDLALKSIHVLKWYAQEDPMEFDTSEKYQIFCMETPQFAMELDSKLFQYVDTDAYNLCED